MALTAKQEAYCQFVADGHSYADAYRAAYDVSPGYSIHTDVWALNKLPHISRRIHDLKSGAGRSLNLNREWLVDWWWKRMTYDPAELTAWAIGACPGGACRRGRGGP